MVLLGMVQNLRRMLLTNGLNFYHYNEMAGFTNIALCSTGNSENENKQ